MADLHRYMISLTTTDGTTWSAVMRESVPETMAGRLHATSGLSLSDTLARVAAWLQDAEARR